MAVDPEGTCSVAEEATLREQVPSQEGRHPSLRRTGWGRRIEVHPDFNPNDEVGPQAPEFRLGSSLRRAWRSRASCSLMRKRVAAPSTTFVNATHDVGAPVYCKSSRRSNGAGTPDSICANIGNREIAALLEVSDHRVRSHYRLRPTPKRWAWLGCAAFCAVVWVAVLAILL